MRAIFKTKLYYFFLLILLYPIPFSHSEISLTGYADSQEESSSISLSTMNICLEGGCYDIIQASGARSIATQGGFASGAQRTIYVYSLDGESGVSNYIGNKWPLITTDGTLSEFLISSDISANIIKNVDDEILINNQPVYQFTEDINDTDFKGIGLDTRWYALKSNGEKLLINPYFDQPPITDPNPNPIIGDPMPEPVLPIPDPGPMPEPKKPEPKPIKNRPPVFINFISETDIQENETFVYEFNAFDPDGDDIYFSIEGEDADLFSISENGRLSFKDAPDYEEPINSNFDNRYAIKIIVSDSLNPAGQATINSMSPLKGDSNDFVINVANFDEDIIAFSLTGIDGTNSTPPAIEINMEVDSYTDPNEAQVLISQGEQQYWSSLQPLSQSNLKFDYDYRFNLPANAPGGTWEVKQINLVADNGTYTYSKQLLINKGYQTSVSLQNPIADEVNPELIAIQNINVTGIDSDPNTNIIITAEATVSDAQSDFSRAGGNLESPNYDGGGGKVSDWAQIDHNSSPNVANFAWILDPKTASGEYKINPLRLYDDAGNRTVYLGTDTELGAYGGYKITINNPIEDTHTPELSNFKLSGSVDTDSRKVLKIETTINNGAVGNSELKRQYIRIKGPNIGNYDTDNFNLQSIGTYENEAFIRLPRGAPDGIYEVDFFFVVDNALNDNKLNNQELANAFGENRTKVAFGTNLACPAITSAATFNVNENQTAIGSVTVSPECTNLSFTLSGEDVGAITISNTGELNFVTAPDYETKTSYTVNVTVTDTVSNETSSQTLQILINNLNDNDPVITSANTFTVDEGSTAVGTVTATDADGDTLSYTLSGSDAAFFSLGTNSGLLSFVTASDYEEQASYSISVTASDGTNSVSQAITVNLNDVFDDCPTITSPALFTADENQTLIGSITVGAECSNIIFELQGTDSAQMTINNLTGEMNFVSAPDFETKKTYSAIAKSTDTTTNQTNLKAFQVDIANLNDNTPVITSADNITLDEGLSAVITITATDQDDSSDPGFTTFTYSLSGTDASFFTIGSSGNLSFVTAGDYETQSSYNFTVTVSDGANSTNQSFTVNLNDLNDEVPTFTSPSTFTVDENQTSVGTVIATDDDSNTAITYSITGGSDAAEFNIDVNSGEITFNSAPDYETQSSFILIVTASDSTNTTEQSITVLLNNLNDNHPIIGNPITFTVDENHQTVIGTLVATDADGDALKFRYWGNADGGPINGQYVNINEDTGEISWNQSAFDLNRTPNYEYYISNGIPPEYNFEFQVCDEGLSAGKCDYEDVVITVNDINEAPSAPNQIAGSPLSLSRGEGASILAGYIEDEDGDTISWTVTGGVDASIISISSAGYVTYDGADADYENPVDTDEDNVYEYQILVSDGQLSSTIDVVETITNVNDNRATLTTTNFNITENGENIVWLGSVLEDLDGVPGQSYGWPGGWQFSFCQANYDDDNLFELSDTGSANVEDDRFEFKDGQDYENPNDANGDNNYQACIRVYDGEGWGPDNPVTVTVTNLNESPYFSQQTASPINTHPTTSRNYYQLEMVENQTSVTFNGTNGSGTSGIFFDAADDEGDTLSFTIESIELDSGSTYFSINSATGVISWTGNTPPDFENLPDMGNQIARCCAWKFPVRITVSDGNSSNYIDGDIQVSDINEPVTFTSSSWSVAENQNNAGDIMNYLYEPDNDRAWSSTANGEPNGTYSFAISGGDSALLSVDSSTGVLTFNSDADYETKSSYNFDVTVVDSTFSPTVTTSQSVQINIIDGTDQATFGCAQSNDPCIFTEPENGDNYMFHLYMLQDGNLVSGNGDFGCDPCNGFNVQSDGEVSYSSASNDYETAPNQTFTATWDNYNDSFPESTQVVNVVLTNVNDIAPVFTSGSSFSADENQTAIGTVTATDAEGDTITYSISGSEISINSSTGVLTFDSAPDYETKSSYSAVVTASDGVNSTTQTITVSINDVVEDTNTQPVATAASHAVNLLPKDQTSKTLTLAGTDADGDSLTYAIVSNPSQGTVSLSGATVTYQTNSGVDTAQTDTFTFKVNDGTVDSAAATITLDLRTDPLYQHQWHLDNVGQLNFASYKSIAGQDLNVNTVISDGYTGSGVLVNIVDEGLELAHEDLADNIVTGSYDLLNLDTDPTNDALNGDHGTSVAGITASVGWNNKGGRGVAPEASLIGYNFLKNQSFSSEAQSWGINPPGGVQADIYNLSYGSGADTSGWAVPQTRANSNHPTEDALESVVTNQRNGKGAIIVKSSGNDYHRGSITGWYCGENSGTYPGDDVSCVDTSIDPKHMFPQVIVTAALNADRLRSSYSTPGPSIWISGFGGEDGYNEAHLNSQGISASLLHEPAIMTTDQTGCANGYVGSNGDESAYEANEFQNHSGGYSENSNCNYTSRFNGTSSAAPSVSGVIALMLEANPNLEWRDVKHILANTADKLDDTRSCDPSFNSCEWKTNAAGYHFSTWYGFGRINAADAISAAESYSTDLGNFVTTGLMAIDSSYQNSASQTGVSQIPIVVSAPSADPSANIVEFVRLNLKIDQSLWCLGIKLESPQETKLPVLQPLMKEAGGGGYWFSIGINGFYGEEIVGTWKVELWNYCQGDITIIDMDMEVMGR